MNKKKGVIIFIIVLLVCLGILCGYSFKNQLKLISEIVIVELGEDIRDDVSYYATGNIENAVLDLSKVNIKQIGEYEAVIKNDNHKVSFTIQIKDTIEPQAEAIENLLFYTLEQINASQLVKNIIDESNVTISFADGDTKSYEIGGDYTEKVLLKDECNNVTVLEVPFHVIEDTTKPQLKGIKNIIAYIGDRIDYLTEVTAIDDKDGNITNKIIVDDKSVELDKIGSYTVIYSVSDRSGNQATKKMKLTIKEDKAPTITGVCNKVINVNGSINYIFGVKAIDDRDGNLTSKIKVNSSKVNIAKVGTYKVIYSVTDSTGNKAEKIITVTVKDKTMDTNNRTSSKKESSVNNNTSSEKTSKKSNSSVKSDFLDVTPKREGKSVDGNIPAGGEQNVGTW